MQKTPRFHRNVNEPLSNLEFCSSQVKKLEPWHTYCVHYATITKPYSLHLISRLQFPWSTSSIAVNH